MSYWMVTSWNVNSVRARLSNIVSWLEANPVDILALQETKTTDEHFPSVFEEMGYRVVHAGQKSYNGVALISKEPAQNIHMGFADYHDPQKRVLDASIGPIRILNLYIPNGAAVGSDKYAYKRSWLTHAYTHIQQAVALNIPFVVVGDFNIAPTDLDVHDPDKWSDGILVSPPERAWFQSVLALGMTDTFRDLNPESKTFSWWDYRGGSFRRDHGLRIDFILASPQLNWHQSSIDQHCRAEEKPSDHAPVTTTFSI